jgi:hypothetical protein
MDPQAAAEQRDLFAQFLVGYEDVARRHSVIVMHDPTGEPYLLQVKPARVDIEIARLKLMEEL